MTAKETQEIMDRYEKEIHQDILSGMPLQEVIEKYKQKVREELYPREYIAIIRLDAPKFANERVTTAMIKNKLPTSRVLAIAELTSPMAVEVILHNLETGEPTPLTEKIQ